MISMANSVAARLAPIRHTDDGDLLGEKVPHEGINLGHDTFFPGLPHCEAQVVGPDYHSQDSLPPNKLRKRDGK